MAIQSAYSPDRYTGNGSTTEFAYTFKITDSSHIKVTVSEVADDTNSLDLTEDTHYTVADVGEETGGTITLLDLSSTIVGAAVLPSTFKVTLSSNAPYTQLTDLANQGAFNAETHEDTFDNLCRLIQQNKESLDRCPKVTQTSGDEGDALLTTINTAVDDAETAQAAAEAAQSAAETAQTGAETAETNAETAETNAAASAASIDQAFRKLKGRNASGGVLAAFKCIKATGDYATDTVPTIDVISSLDDTIIGFTFEALNDNETDLYLEKGRVVITGFDCSGASVGDKVFTDASGDPTLSDTGVEIGEVLDNASNGVVLINLSAGGQSSADGTPSGSILPYAGASIPDGYLDCNGAAVSRTTYSGLFAALGETWGAGDGSTTFNIPDLRSATLRGVGTPTIFTSNDAVALADTIDDQMQGHHHESFAEQNTAAFVSSSSNRAQFSSVAGNNTVDVSTANITRDPDADGTNGTPRTGTETTGKARGVYYIIKT